jgi:hypothetical protein
MPFLSLYAWAETALVALAGLSSSSPWRLSPFRSIAGGGSPDAGSGSRR